MYFLVNVTLQRVAEIKDLAVIFDEWLSLKSPIDHVVNLAFKKLFYIFRILKNIKDTDALCLLYNFLVRLILCNASSVWSQYYDV